MVLSIINYGSAVWGTKEYSVINSIHNKACRFFLGVGKYTPSAAVQGEMGWKTPTHQQWLSVTRLWCRLINMDVSRVTKRVFLWMMEMAVSGKRNWGYEVYHRYNDLNMHNLTNLRDRVNVKATIEHTDVCLSVLQEQQWLHIINREEGRNGSRNKLRTYKQFKKKL